jgi:hypothetical protein
LPNSYTEKKGQQEGKGMEGQKGRCESQRIRKKLRHKRMKAITNHWRKAY